MSLCDIGSQMHHMISESAFAREGQSSDALPRNRSFQERRYQQRAALDQFTLHIRACTTCAARRENTQWQH